MYNIKKLYFEEPAQVQRNFWKAIKMPTCTILYLFHYHVLDNLNWLVFAFSSNLTINLMYNKEICTLTTSTSSEFKNYFDKTR